MRALAALRREPPPAEDLVLARRVAGGDEDALRRVFELHGGFLVAYARGVLRDADEAEDVAGEALARFWRTAGRYRGECALRPYLARIAVNLCRDRLRRRREAPAFVPPAESDPRVAAVREAMALLDPADREILVLAYGDGLTSHEAAAALGLAAPAFRMRLTRARRRLRAVLEAG